MSSIVGQEKMSIEETLEHYGVKGMKWGRRKAERSARLQRLSKGGTSKADKVNFVAKDATLPNLVKGRGNIQTAAKLTIQQKQRRDALISKGAAKAKDIVSLQFGKKTKGEIKSAQKKSVAVQKSMNEQRRKIKLATSDAQVKREKAALQKMARDWQNDPDRATSLRTTNGQKAALTLLSVAVYGPVAGGIGAGVGLGSVSVASRKVAYNQSKRG